MTDKYVLPKDGQCPVPEPDLTRWAQWFEKADRIVAVDMIGEVRVSTVFLGLDHNFSGQSKPILWESMTFGGPLDQHQDRCSGNREQAEAMHARMVKRVKEPTWRNQKETMSNDERCPLCGLMTNSLAGNPGEWPIALEYVGGNGQKKVYHRACVVAAIAAAQEIVSRYPSGFSENTAAEPPAPDHGPVSPPTT